MISFVLAAFAAVQPAPAVAPQHPLRREAVQDRAAISAQVQALFARIDLDRDGFVTRQEAQGARRANRGDRAEGAQRGPRGQRAADPARQQQRRMAAFDRLDTDRNGVLSRAEFGQAAQLRAERQAARIERGRGAGGGQMGLRGRMFELADVNRDGRVSLQEATAAAYQRFDMADLNRDGRLTREERKQNRERRRGEQRPRG